MNYPIVLNVEGKLCVVIGAGEVGMRKARGLSAAGAKVRLVAPEAGSVNALLPAVEWLRRPYRDGDLDGAFLAFAATGDRAVNAAVAAEARHKRIPVTIADDPEAGDFSLPALLRRGSLTVAVATQGGSPASAALVRDHLEGVLGAEWGLFVAIAAALRTWLRKEPTAVDGAAICRQLAAQGMLSLLAAGDSDAIDALLGEVGIGTITLATLGIDLKKAGAPPVS